MTVKFRVVSWNINEGRPQAGYWDALDQLAELRPDIVLIQEAVKDSQRDQVEEIGSACELQNTNFLPGRSSFWSFFPFVPVRSKKLGEAGTGIGIATRFPVTAWHGHELATDRSLLTIAPGRIQMDQPRQVIACELDVEGHPLSIACTHLSWKPGVNGDQLRQTEEFLKTLPADRVLGGDFNARSNNTGWASLAVADTYPAAAPKTQIDHIVGEAIGLDSFAARLSSSDHLALVADLILI